VCVFFGGLIVAEPGIAIRSVENPLCVWSNTKWFSGCSGLGICSSSRAPWSRLAWTSLRQATVSAGLTGFHFHDLRRTGNHIAAATGASLRELMGRMGHSTTRAALIYQHRTAERDRLIAAVMSDIVEAELGTASKPSGTYGHAADRTHPDVRQKEL
jgi:hypothetical protein